MKLYNNIYFIRHLKTLNNKLCIISGQSDSEIVDNDYNLIDISKFDKVYCSPSLRCRRTIELLSNNSSLADHIIYDERLLERDMGSLEGLLKEESRKNYPEFFKGEKFCVFKTPPGGESYECFKKRIEDFYKDYLCMKISNRILVCSHNQTLKLLRLLILKKDITDQSWIEYSFKNGELTEIKI